MVKNIFLIRHAEALAPVTGQRDFDRRLSETGRKQALLLGEHLKALNQPVQAIYTSPSFRTLETTLQITSLLENKPRVIESEELYSATTKLMLAAIARLDDMFDSVYVIGHNPAMAAVFEHFTGSNGTGFSTATCAWLQFPFEQWNQLSGDTAEQKDFYYPGLME